MNLLTSLLYFQTQYKIIYLYLKFKIFDLRQNQNDSFTIWREYYVLTPTFSPTLTICKGHLLTSIIRLFLQFQWQVNQSTSIKYARQPLVTVNMPMGHVLLGTSTCGVSFVTVKVPEFILVDIYIFVHCHMNLLCDSLPYHQSIYLYSCINKRWRLYGEGW